MSCSSGALPFYPVAERRRDADRLRPVDRDRIRCPSPRQRIRPQLEFHHFAFLPLAALDVVRRAARIGRPHALALPAEARIIDAAIETLGVEAHWIGHAQGDELAVE